MILHTFANNKKIVFSTQDKVDDVNLDFYDKIGTTKKILLH